MHRVEATVTCPVYDSFRVQQVAGMFDVPLAERATERFSVEIPGPLLARLPASRTSNGPGGPDGWRIGLVVGPSASGKSTIAERMFGDSIYRGGDWPPDKAVVDAMGQRPIKEITGMFTAVGFSSPPSWIKPYRVLSGGEQFRCDLARALLGEPGRSSGEPGRSRPGSTRVVTGPARQLVGPARQLVVFDEFTSVVDRNVARIASAAIAKGIHFGRIACRFVAVTCHYDVTEWLQPDWVIDMATSEFHRRRLRRPPIELAIFRVGRAAWRLFARHHYLSGSLSRAARCFLALWHQQPVAFCATVSLIGKKRRWRISRIVTLPDYQGVGIGSAVMEAVADLHRAEGHRVNITTSHPAMIGHLRRSPRWRAVGVRKTGSHGTRRFISNYRSSAGRAVVSFEYLPGS